MKPNAKQTRVVDLFNSGLTYGQISTKLKITKGSVAGMISRAKKAGSEVKAAGRRLSDKDLLAALKMRDAGQPIASIAAFLRIEPARAEAEFAECDQGQ